jgi:hypothetical protein
MERLQQISIFFTEDNHSNVKGDDLPATADPSLIGYKTWALSDECTEILNQIRQQIGRESLLRFAPLW